MKAVVTGIGVTAPNGVGIEEYWAATLAGTSGLGPITRFDASRYRIRVGGEVTGLGTLRVPGRLAVQTDRWSHLGFIAAELALADATVSPADLPEYELAVVTASSSGGTEFGQREIEKLWSKGPMHVSAYQSIAWFYAATTGQLSIRYGMRGPCGVICSEQAGGLDSLAQARRLIRQGTRLVLSGGTDASLSWWRRRGRRASGARPATAPSPATARPSTWPAASRVCGGPPNWPWPTRDWHRPMWTSSSPTRSASRTPTGPRRTRSARSSARTASRSPRPRR
jgi:act minimal PKS chain-length factor (CLF/KS beta)